jgi:hypothetical protein
MGKPTKGRKEPLASLDKAQGQGERLMGCFNSVKIACPKCGKVNELQSKAGSCEMEVFDPRLVPPAEAVDLDGTTCDCSHCDCSFTVVAALPQYVHLVAVE